nr:C45 family peptidase [Cloacibacillus porcorum]
MLKSNVDGVRSCISFVEKHLLKEGAKADIKAGGGCSAFAVRAGDGKVIYGRNFDYKMDMTAVLIRTAPKGGYVSIGLADAGWVGYGIGSLGDGVSDISMAVGLPYLIMDGMNEKGLAVSVFYLDGEPARQNTGKPKIMTTVAMRLMLDRAANVDEALALVGQYDMQSAMPDANFHFLISDASGRSVVLEYCGNKQSVLDEHYVTNFYLDPSMKGLGHGKDRYEILKSVLAFKKDVLSEKEAMSLLEMVSQPETEASTSMTQWSVVYNLTDLNATVAIRREYEKLFRFSINDISGK